MVHRQSEDGNDDYQHSKQQKNMDVHLRCSLPLRPRRSAFVEVGREMLAEMASTDVTLVRHTDQLIKGLSLFWGGDSKRTLRPEA